MKKLVYLFMVVSFTILLCGCSFAHFNTDQEGNGSSGVVESSNSTQTTTNSNTQSTKEKVYFHAALQGAVIVSMDKDKVIYQQKCDVCGTLKSNKITIHHSSGTFTSSFNCSKCKNHQVVKIQSSYSYQ